MDRHLSYAFIMAYHNKRHRHFVVKDNISTLLFTDNEFKTFEEEAIANMHQSIPGISYRKDALRYYMNKLISPLLLANTVFSEKSLERALIVGVKQYIIIDCGYNTFAHRQPEWANKLQIFETNTIAVAMNKQSRVTRAGIPQKDNHHYICADIEKPGFADLIADHPAYNKNKNSHISLSDISNHIDKESFKQLCNELFKIVSSGSSICFSYDDKKFSYEQIEDLMSKCGFLIYEHIGPQEMEDEYFHYFNLANIRTPLRRSGNTYYCLAVKK